MRSHFRMSYPKDDKKLNLALHAHSVRKGKDGNRKPTSILYLMQCNSGSNHLKIVDMITAF